MSKRYKGKRARAWRNILVAAINAAIDQGIIGTCEGEHQWDDSDAVPGRLFRFTVAGLPAVGWVRDEGFGQLVMRATVSPNPECRFVSSVNAGFLAGEANAHGWLERREGCWLKSCWSPPYLWCRAHLLDRLADLKVEPMGYLDSSRVVL